MDFITMLSGWQWALLALVPPAIIALYFLKLKRMPLEVPSTYLWHRTIEDLHVNSLWQRLRSSLLLFLQLLFVILLAIALLRPHWQSTRSVDERLIFLVDNSASMQANDLAPSRLARAKETIAEQVEQMDSSDVAMIISFANAARPEQSFTSNKQLLLEALERIQLTSQPTALDDALVLAAGLANPSRTGSDSWDAVVAEPQPATLYIYSDGKFRDVQGFSLGVLKPVFVPLGDAKADNLGIVAFSVRRNEERPDRLQAFGRIENFGAGDARMTTELYLDGQLIDASEVNVKTGDGAGVAFDLSDRDSGVLELRLARNDALPADNRAWAVINQPRPAKVLLVTSGNEPLEKSLGTGAAAKLAEVVMAKPDDLKTAKHKSLVAAGAFDLVIYDDCKPEEMPRANTWFVGQLPPTGDWEVDQKAVAPQIIDVDRNHPIMQWVEAGDVLIAEAITLNPPAGASRLIETTKGLLFAVAPREGFEDAVLGIDLYASDEAGNTTVATNWPIRQSFPTLVYGVLEYLGGHSQPLAGDNVQPGVTVDLRSESARQLLVRSPSGQRTTLSRGPRNVFAFSNTQELGPYEVMEGDKVVQRFTVNLFDPLESDIRPREENAIRIGFVDVVGESAFEPARFETWKYLLVLALGVLLFEWYIYNRRVYL
jgi:hypothetical protein